jgi:Sugar efflux transporter for intercellular exchange
VTAEIIVAALTTVLSVAVKVIGLPDQIKSNYARKSTLGLSGWFVTLTFFSYGCWTLDGIMQHNWTIIIGQGLGVLTTGVLACQFWWYRSSERRTAPSLLAWVHMPGLWSRVRRSAAKSSPKHD